MYFAKEFMSDIIKLLPDHVANQIAAGEVIQRPASVVKELLDNAVDAGATQIDLIIKEGGKTLIQVFDNGTGMSVTDARMCWERHATSKIKSAEDIYAIKTMGFRGEALASIASVAQVEMRTKQQQDNLGTMILIEGSRVIKQESITMLTGTQITVKNLFYNIPARRNFLKSNPVETRHIFDEFTRAALSNPHIAFTLTNQKEMVYDLKSGDLSRRIFELFGYEKNKDLLPLNEETTIANISGFVGKPENAKKTRGEQFFFVNNRYIKDAYLNHAMMAGYDQIISKEQFPFYLVNIDINPQHIDVNVHPTKTEIKFDDEKSLYQILRAVCKKAVGEHYHVPIYTPMSDDGFLQLNQPSNQPLGNNDNRSQVSPSYKNEHQHFSTHQTQQKDWQALFQLMQKEETIGDMGGKKVRPPQELPGFETSDVLHSRLLINLHGIFILTTIKNGIILIDISAAHERVLFSKYMDALQNQPIASQQILFPKTVSFSSPDASLLRDLLADIRALGFDVNELGGNTFSVNGVPAELNHYNEQHLLEEVLELYKQQTHQETRHQRIAKILAQRAAVKPGTKLNQDEMSLLTDELFACVDNKVSPSGKSCFKNLSIEDLYKLINQPQ